MERKLHLLGNVDCEIATDNLTRQLYATDASVYQIEPVGVAFPRSAQQAAAAVKAAVAAGVSVIPRGAGTGLVGGAVGDGLIVEFSRYNRQITEFNPERKTVRVGAGVVLDQLNAFLKPKGFCFGPDVATSSRATLGGMISNNSSGAHTPVYGCTSDHVKSLEVVLADGRITTLDLESDGLAGKKKALEALVRKSAREIQERMPLDLLKRWPGYGVDRFLREANLAHLLGGSEGTLGPIISAELNIMAPPKKKTLGLIFFSSVMEAMEATVALLDLHPAAIEHVDRVLFDQTRGQLNFKAARDLMELDAKPCEALLLVEFFDDTGDKLKAVAAKKLGLRTLLLEDPAQMNLVWNMRKAGLSLLTGCKGAAKPVTAIEDTAVRPAQLPAYVGELQKILKRQNLDACFYGHAASGLLHVRPVLDLHDADDLKKFRIVSDETAALVKQFKGSLAAEHGVGIARTEYMPEQLGGELLGLMREIKTTFDPDNIFNPGKIFPDNRYKIDTWLRMGACYKLELPFEPVLAFAAKDGSFVGNLEQCNGCGGCRKDAPTMCPTFLATGEEIMSTRGRANAIRAALEMRGGEDPLACAEMEVALSNCLSCKACTTECPSNVNLALLKAELIHARHRRDGVTLRERMISSVDLLGKLGCIAPGLANFSLKFSPLRAAMEKFFGFAAKRPLPPYTTERFDHWFKKRPGVRTSSSAATLNGREAQVRSNDGAANHIAADEDVRTPKRGRVILWDDTFVRYHEPHIGKAAVAVLEAAGFEVVLATGRKCCGRPAFSQGVLDKAGEFGRHNLELLRGGTEPILFLEASCYSMFAEDYAELKLEGAAEVKKRCFLFEQFVDALLTKEPDAIRFKTSAGEVAIHAHCHAKSLLNPSFMKRLIERVPGKKATLLETGCCGMAGAFGAMEKKYDLSVKVAQPLLEKLEAQGANAQVVASGTSCRHQIEHLSPKHPKHIAEVLAECLG